MFFLALIVFGVFLTLKLMEKEPVSNWSWWWITSPLWIYAIFVAVMVVLVIATGAAVSVGM